MARKPQQLEQSLVSTSVGCCLVPALRTEALPGPPGDATRLCLHQGLGADSQITWLLSRAQTWQRVLSCLR